MTNLQTEKVEEIASCYGAIKEVHFKAPTGSGKTLMAINVISKIINDNPAENFIFVIATVSTSELPQAFETKINEYKNDLPYSDFEVEYIESPSSSQKNNSDSVPQIRIVKNKVYIFGKATFGKGRIYTEQNVIPDFISECKMHGYKIIYIRDEAHIGTSTKTKEVETFESLMNRNANFILKMTATFNNTEVLVKRVELREKELKDVNKNENKWLIKCNLQKISDETTHDSDLLDKAIVGFKKIQEEYKTLSFQIKPAMLIQVDNEPTDNDEKIIFQNTLQMIKDKLNQSVLSWVQYFGDTNKESSNVDNANFTLSKITRTDDPTDCIIFKIGPATGWDIPRACMLLQLRNVYSSNLNIQTIGRIKRNPYPNLAKNDITDKYYIFTNAPKDKNSDYSIYDYKVKDIFKNEELAVIRIDKEKTKNNNLNIKELSTEIQLFLQNKNNEISVKITDCFDNDSVYIEKDKKLVLKNPILLLKRIKILQDNLNYHQKLVITKVEKVYKKYFIQISWKKLQIILLSNFVKNITDIYKKCMPSNVKYKIDLEKVNPQIYTEMFEANTENLVDTNNSKYMFDIKKDGQETSTQLLDSSKEDIIANKLKTYFETMDDKIKVWVKNQTSPCNIYGEYLDDLSDANKPNKSYFDFVIKFENGNYLYLEVKGADDSDIDKEKTALLEKAYKDYFVNMNNELFKHKMVICILKVKDKNNITPVCCYDKNIVENDLTNYTLPKILQELAK